MICARGQSGYKHYKKKYNNVNDIDIKIIVELIIDNFTVNCRYILLFFKVLNK